MHRNFMFALMVGSAATMLSLPASAQATRTWVSGNGSDSNPCSLTSPCKTFAGAISKTAINGEINCLDAGGYGAVVIAKSITIDCTGTYASILAGTGNGIIINIAPKGQPRPFEKHTCTVVAPRASRAGARPEATDALKKRAPSTCTAMPLSRQCATTASKVSMGHTDPPPPFDVFSTTTHLVRG